MSQPELLASRARVADEPIKILKLKRMVSRWPKHSYGMYVKEKDKLTKIIDDICDKHCEFCGG